MRLKDFMKLDEYADLKKKKWTVLTLGDLDEETRHMLWDMYVDTYQSIGLHIEDASKLTSKYKISWLIDNDNDPKIDAFIIYKETKYGNKLALMGSDGQKPNKKVLIKQMIDLLKQKSWHIEASHKVAQIIESNGVKVIDDEDTIKSIIGKSFVEMLSDGEYKRSLGTLGVVKKKMYGSTK